MMVFTANPVWYAVVASYPGLPSQLFTSRSTWSAQSAGSKIALRFPSVCLFVCLHLHRSGVIVVSLSEPHASESTCLYVCMSVCTVHHTETMIGYFIFCAQLITYFNIYFVFLLQFY